MAAKNQTPRTQSEANANDGNSADLEARFAALEEMEKNLEKREADILMREQKLDEREMSLAAEVIDEAEAGLSEEEQGAIDALCKEMGISPEFVFASNVDRGTGAVTVLTNGGARVCVAPGDEIPRLTEIQITGVNPELARRKPVAGKKR